MNLLLVFVVAYALWIAFIGFLCCLPELCAWRRHRAEARATCARIDDFLAYQRRKAGAR